MSIIDPQSTGEEPWYPDHLPKWFFQRGFSYEPVKSTNRVAVDTGLTKVVGNFTLIPWKLTGSFLVNESEKNDLDTFIADEIENGALPFWKADPFVPARGWLWRLESPPQYVPAVRDLYLVTLRLDRLPENPGDLEGGFTLIDSFSNYLTDASGKTLGA